LASPIIYSIDTSSIFKWYIEVYPPTIFEGLRERVEELIAAGRLHSPKAVFDEIKPGDDCHAWAKGQTDLFVEEFCVHAADCAQAHGHAPRSG
jgi:hypothetical protein